MLTIDIADGQIQTVRSVISRAKLQHLGPLADLAELQQAAPGLAGRLGQQRAAFDDGAGCPGRLGSRGQHGLLLGAEVAVQQHQRVAVRDGLNRDGECLILRLVDCADVVQEGIQDRPLGGLYLWMLSFLQPEAEEDLEQRPLLAGEAHVRVTDRGQGVGRSRERAEPGRQICAELLVGPDRDGCQQLFPVGEVRVGSADRDAEPRLAAAIEKARTPPAAISSIAVSISALRRSPWW